MAEMEAIDISEMPATWALCQSTECERSGECLRHLMFHQMPANRTSWPCLLPAAVQPTATCAHFVKAEKVRMAWGWCRLYGQLQGRKLQHAVRMALTNMLGSKGTYYRYRNGERPMNAAMQQMVTDRLRAAGYNGEVVFDRYGDAYDFTL